MRNKLANIFQTYFWQCSETENKNITRSTTPCLIKIQNKVKDTILPLVRLILSVVFHYKGAKQNESGYRFQNKRKTMSQLEVMYAGRKLILIYDVYKILYFSIFTVLQIQRVPF